MNYTKIYRTLISRAKDRNLTDYVESHHIIPRCMNGTDDIDNLVDLTPEEHYLAHQLLVKMYPGNVKLIMAAQMMIPNRPSNKLYGWLKRLHSEAMKESQSGNLNSQYGTMWITNGRENKKIKKDIDPIPEGWYNGRAYVPIFNNIDVCITCRNRRNDLFWWKQYETSGMSILQFVRDVYPYNRAAFYKLKERIKNGPLV